MNDANAASRRMVLASLAWAAPGAALLGGTLAPAWEAFGQASETDLNGTSAVPDCVLKLAPNGQAVSLNKFRGKVLYVDFWASWCARCLLSFPFMNQLQNSYGRQGLQVLAVNMDEKPDTTPGNFLPNILPTSAWRWGRTRNARRISASPTCRRLFWSIAPESFAASIPDFGRAT